MTSPASTSTAPATQVWRTESYLADLALLVRRVRVFLLGVLVAYAAVAFTGGLPGQPVAGWALMAVASSGLVWLNVLSRSWDRDGRHDDRRQLVEVLADAAVMMVLFGLTASVIRFQEFPIGVFLVIVEASLRLRQRRAMTITATITALVVVMRLLLPATWPVELQLLEAARAVPMVVTSLLLAWAVTGTVGRLETVRLQAVAAADQLAAAHELLRSQSQDLAASVADLERFTAVVAHDLRAPIVTATMMARAVRNPAVAMADRMELLGRMGRGLERVTVLLDRLHEHARSTTSELRTEELDLDRLLDEVVEDHGAAIREAGATVCRPTPMPLGVGDEVLVRQVLTNLVGNALRHGRPVTGNLVLTVSGETTEEGVRLTVADNGPGVPVGARDRIFAAGSRARRDGDTGLGLGLATCHNVVRRHGGTLWHHDAAGGGAAFSFVLPLQQDAGTAPVRTG